MTRRRDEVDIMGEALGRLKIPPGKPKPPDKAKLADRPPQEPDRTDDQPAPPPTESAPLRAAAQPEPGPIEQSSADPAPKIPPSPSPAPEPVSGRGQTGRLAEKLKNMRLTGMLAALEEQAEEPDATGLSFEERLDRMLTREMRDRADRRLQLRIKKANLAYDAALAEVDFSLPRELDEARFRSLAGCDWIKGRRNLIITGPVGVGKTFLASALGRQACVKGHDVLYQNLALLLEDLAQARRKGSYTKSVDALAKFDLLILDNWGFTKFNDQQRSDVFGLIEFRNDAKSTLIVSQAPLADWPGIIGDKKQAASIIDRLKHNTHLLAIKGQSLRHRT